MRATDGPIGEEVSMTTKVRDVIAAEQQLEGAEAELARYTNDPSPVDAPTRA